MTEHNFIRSSKPVGLLFAFYKNEAHLMCYSETYR